MLRRRTCLVWASARGAPQRPVTLDLAVIPERVAAVLVDLYVEDVSDHEPGHYLVQVKAVTAP